MKKLFILCITLLACSQLLAASISIPRDFELLALDGKEITSALFNNKKALKLEGGEHKIAVQYKKVLRDDIGDGSTIVFSDPIIIHLQVIAGTDYQLNTSKKIKSASQGKAFVKDPDIKVIASDGKLAIFSVQLVDSNNRGVLGNMADNTTVDSMSVAIQQTEQSGLSQGEQLPMQMLHHWWQQADLATKQEFASWANKQMNE